MLALTIIMFISALVSIIYGIKTAADRGRFYIFIGILIALCAITSLFANKFAFFALPLSGLIIKETCNAVKEK